MASTSNEPSYWPGFVDALSNMVMTLIIIIVLLNIALVYFFYKATKNATQNIQTVVENVKKNSNEEIEALLNENQRLQDELKKALEKNFGPNASNKEESVSRVDIINPTQSNNNGLVKQKSDSPAVNGNTGSASHVEMTEQTEMPTGVEGSANVQTADENLKGVLQDQVLKNNVNKSVIPNTNSIKNNVASEAGNEITIIYEDDNVEFSAKTLLALNKGLGGLISKDKTIKVDITVEITGSDKYSFARRVAYYRASAIRNFVLSKGIDPSRISSRLVDADESVQYPRAIIHLSR